MVAYNVGSLFYTVKESCEEIGAGQKGSRQQSYLNVFIQSLIVSIE